MSDAGEKPFEPTPQRIAKAKREGNVPRSTELGSNVSFACAAAATMAIVPVVAGHARAAIALAASGTAPASDALALVVAGSVPMLAAAFAGSAVSIVQNGGLRVAGFAVNARRLDPLEGMRRAFSRETAAHALRGALACLAAVAAMLPSVAGALALGLRASSLSGVAAAVWQASQRVAFAACAVGTLFACAEFLAARRSWLGKLRMSFDERRRELKEQEGDPFTRSRRRALARSLLRGSVREIDRASFVVVNPTHVAVALEYRPPATPVPRVLIRATDAAALRVRALAIQRRIPIVENAALARALFAQSRAGESIPHALYVAVAEVVAALTRACELET